MPEETKDTPAIAPAAEKSAAQVCDERFAELAAQVGKVHAAMKGLSPSTRRAILTAALELFQ